MSNPYQELLEIFRGQANAPASFQTGVVLTVSPLTVAAGGVVLSAANGLLVSTDLLPRTRKTKITNPESAFEAEVKGAMSGQLTIATEKLEAEIKVEELEGSLVAGDMVLLATADQNIYIVICKVVSA